MSHAVGRLTAGRRILIPKTPSADPPYTTAFFDVGDEPRVLETPDMSDRYIVLPSLWMMNLFEVLWARTTQRWLTLVSWMLGLELHFCLHLGDSASRFEA